jgi:transketolase
MNDLDRLAINTIRTLSIDAVQQANSGHPGTPMALAPLVYALWNRVMRFDPKDPIWPNRDRFVLSNGHASMLLWSVLHLSDTRAVNADYERLGEPSVTLDDIRHFRQLDSKAPGHPEYHWVSGVETTTGPLGQGIATSVGMAIARKWLGSRSASPAAPCPRSDPGPVAFLEGLLDAGAPAPGSAPAPDETASVQDRAKSLERIARELELPPLAGAGVVVCLMG